MGFFSDLNTDFISDAEEVGFSDPDNGLYQYEVIGGELQRGTKKDPNALGFIIKYSLTNDSVTDKKYSEYFGVPQPSDPRNPTDREKQQASFLKARLVSLGVAPDKINSMDADDLIGAEGTLRIITNKGGYKQVRDLKLKGNSAPQAATPVQPVARPATRKAAPKAAPASPAQPEETAEAVPAAPAKAKPTRVVGNPFAPQG
jgi:hypothetical protein